MSTYYEFRCLNCMEQGGFFSRQMWGWGNLDIFTNFKFLVAHHNCGSLQIISEYDDLYGTSDARRRWADRLEADEYLRESVWPHANEWHDVAESWMDSHQKWIAEFQRQLEQDRARSNR